MAVITELSDDWRVPVIAHPQPPPPPPPPPPPLNSTVVLIGDVFVNRTEAAAACLANSSNSRLCLRGDLANKTYSGCCCVPGWCEDWEGWWSPAAVSGCGHEGYNRSDFNGRILIPIQES